MDNYTLWTKHSEPRVMMEDDEGDNDDDDNNNIAVDKAKETLEQKNNHLTN